MVHFYSSFYHKAVTSLSCSILRHVARVKCLKRLGVRLDGQILLKLLKVYYPEGIYIEADAHLQSYVAAVVSKNLNLLFLQKAVNSDNISNVQWSPYGNYLLI